MCTADRDLLFMCLLFQLLSQVTLAQQTSTSPDTHMGQASSPTASHTQAVLNSIQQTLSAASGGNGITVEQPTITVRSVAQSLNNSCHSPLKTSNTNATAHILGKISEIGASGHINNTAVNLANQILATRVSSTQLINHVPSSLEGLMPSKYTTCVSFQTSISLAR